MRIASKQVAEKPTAAPAPKASQFPPAMRAYVERAFLAAKTPEQKKAMAPALKAVIDAASANGELWMTNWDTLPLPNIAALAANGDAAAAASSAVDSLQQGALNGPGRLVSSDLLHQHKRSLSSMS